MAGGKVPSSYSSMGRSALSEWATEGSKVLGVPCASLMSQSPAHWAKQRICGSRDSRLWGPWSETVLRLFCLRGCTSVQVGKGWHRPWTTQRYLSRAWEVGLYCQGLFAEEETSRHRIVTELGLQMTVWG